MKKICLQTWVPLRKEATSASEMISSMLFGETCEVLESNGEWKFVECTLDGYKGWIPENYLENFDENYGMFSRVLSSQSAVLTRDAERIHLSAGSNLPEGNEVNIHRQKWKLTLGETHNSSEPWEIAKGFLNVPYLWGGRSDCGMDCSGLTQIVFKIKNKQLPRDSKDQALLGQDVSFADRQPNDLAFFANKDGNITHVGIIGKSGFIHASGRVREDDLTEKGIVNRETGQLTHQLAHIKRLAS